MLNSDAHHSLIWEAEPRICRFELSKTDRILNEMALIVNRKIYFGPQTTRTALRQPRICGPFHLTGDELVRQNHCYWYTFKFIRQNWLVSGILIYVDDDRRFAIGAA